MTHVVYCDDEASFQSAFQRHSSPEFQITVTKDVHGLPQFLQNMKRLPDLLVLDLYHTVSSPDSDEAKRANDEVDQKLKDVNKAMEELRVPVNKGKRPDGLKYLTQIRKIPKLEDLPVLLYTRQGLSLLDDEQLGEAYSLHAEWMVKGRSPEFERGRMRAFLKQERLRRKRFKRDVRLTLVGVALGLLATMIYEAIKIFIMG